jgi:SET domain-containing protein
MGAFATPPIAEGTRLIEYTGERIRGRWPTPATTTRWAPPHVPVLGGRKNSDHFVTPPSGGKQARFINPLTCDPSCEAIQEGKRIFIDSVRDIRSLEQG